MSSYDDAYLDDYDYYQNTGELSEYFEDEDENEEAIDGESQSPIIDKTTMSNIKLKYLNELTEVHDAVATKYGVELKSFVFRSVNEYLTLYMEFVYITKKRKSDSLEIHVVLYDKDGDIFSSKTSYMFGGSLVDFEVIELTFDNVVPSDIGRVAIYFQKD